MLIVQSTCVIPGRRVAPSPEPMNTVICVSLGFADTARSVFMGSGLAGFARAPE